MTCKCDFVFKPLSNALTYELLQNESTLHTGLEHPLPCRYVFTLFAAIPSIIMDFSTVAAPPCAADGRLHNGG